MSQANVDLVLSLYAAAERQDFEGTRDVWADDVVWDMSGLALPGMAEVYRGLEGLVAFWRSWLAAWDRIEWVGLTAEDHGEDVLVEVRQRNRGRASGVPVDLHYWQVFTVRDGQVTRSVMAETREAALALMTQAD